MAGGRSFIQPSVVGYDSRVATAFYRSSSDERAVGMAITSDTGTTWSEPQNLGLPNPDSSLNALLLSEGRILLAFNDSKQTRENLRLAISYDGGANWMRVAEIENNPGDEFSYPYMIRSLDGRIHLVYTWRRKRIKHVVFNENWINGQIKKASK
jgi:predicted neuraminidase